MSFIGIIASYVLSRILIIHEEKTKEITTVKRFGYVILIVIKFGELLL